MCGPLGTVIVRGDCGGVALKLIKPNRKTEAQNHNKLNKNVDNLYEVPTQ